MFSNRQFLAAEYQRTLRDSITINGRGLHSGLLLMMTLIPAEANRGYMFLGRDVAPLRADVPVRWRKVIDACSSSTVASASGIGVSTK